MNRKALQSANSVIRDLGNQTEYLDQYNVDDRACESLERFYEAYGLAPSSKVDELSSFISQNNMIYLGNVREQNGGITEMYVSNASESANHRFYRIQLQKDTLISGNIAFEEVQTNYDMSDDYVFESAFLTDDFDFFDYALEADAPPANNDQNQNNNVEDITKTTADAMGDDANDGIPMFGGDQNNNGPSSGGVDPNTDTSAPGDNGSNDDGGDDDFMGGDSDDGNDDQQPPDMMDETDDGDGNDEGTASKQRIRANMVKLHNVIQDSLNAMDTFTPDYGLVVSKQYYKIREYLSTIDGLLLKIVNETINDMTVEVLMKKYTTLNNIYDIIIRKMRVFKQLYRKEIEAKH